MIRLPFWPRHRRDRLEELSAERAKYTDFALYRRLLVEARPYWAHIVGIFFLSLLSIPFTLLAPVPLKIVVDNVIGDQPVGSALDRLLPDSVTGNDDALLVAAIVGMLLLALVNQLRDLAITVLRTYTGEKLVLSFRARLFGHVQRLSLSYHDSKGTADSIYRIQNDAPSIQQIAIDGVIPFITSILTLASIFFVVWRINWQLLLVGLSVAPILYLLSRSYRPRLRMQSREVKKLDSSSWSVVQEALTSLRVVKAFGREERERARFVTQSDNRVRARVVLSFNEAWFALLLGMTTAVGGAAALYIGARLVNSGSLTLGEMLLVTAYLAQIYDPLTKISKKAASLQLAMASAERAFTLLDHQPDVAERKHAIPLIRASGAIQFRDVSFAYDEEHRVIEGLSMSLPAGTTLGIAGTTGAGKTTLMSLLTRFYDPTGGSIFLDGVDIRDYRLADLRNQFAIVLQEPVLFSATVAENIAYARPGASFEEIVAAAQSADAHDFIMRLPDGYDTPVGERGMRLSGGERQRISLARAFLKDAPILLLDEPTSSVDVKTEASILTSLERLMKGRTTVMIAHRLSTLERCDIRIQLEHGKIVERVEVPAPGTPAPQTQRSIAHA